MGNELTTDEVLGLLAELGQSVTASTWRAYVAREQAPQPVRRVGRTPLWDENAIREWAKNRPGSGARTDLRRKSMTTTEYGTWATAVTSPTTVEDYVRVALGDFADDFDQDAIAADFRDAINAALPDGVSLNGNDFYGPYSTPHKDRPNLREVVESVDFWEIAARHDTTS